LESDKTVFVEIIDPPVDEVELVVVTGVEEVVVLEPSLCTATLP
jgi:hypothetical protein